jgi:hypothetical protein
MGAMPDTSDDVLSAPYIPPAKRVPGPTPTPLTAWLYAVRVNEYVKIGTARDLRLRVRHFQTGSPYPVTYIGAVQIWQNYLPQAERSAHRFLEECAARGEWFQTTDARALDALSHAESRYGHNR